jgi:hypothetical protein
MTLFLVTTVEPHFVKFDCPNIEFGSGYVKATLVVENQLLHRGTYWLQVTVTGWYHTKRPMHCGHVLNCCAPSRVLITSNPSTSALWLQQRHLVAKHGIGEKCP